jgi:protease II
MEIVGHVLEGHPERVRAAAAASALVDVVDTVTADRTLEQPPLLIRSA